ncbi:uncharacterized protein LOC113332898 [Papaver somniferum]|uniref:uncharacterized protein LOC113332898 n=1 Tax=Papaver somniferum TaxID=3469 RepID=UPI000E6FC4FD|nr:uncharacterized protein LOC113332898 [Papaver somniferum]
MKGKKRERQFWRASNKFWASLFGFVTSLRRPPNQAALEAPHFSFFFFLSFYQKHLFLENPRILGLVSNSKPYLLHIFNSLLFTLLLLLLVVSSKGNTIVCGLRNGATVTVDVRKKQGVSTGLPILVVHFMVHRVVIHRYFLGKCLRRVGCSGLLLRELWYLQLAVTTEIKLGQVRNECIIWPVRKNILGSHFPFDVLPSVA